MSTVKTRGAQGARAPREPKRGGLGGMGPPAPPRGAAAAVHSTVFSDSTISSFFSFRWAARLTTREKTAVSTPA